MVRTYLKLDSFTIGSYALSRRSANVSSELDSATGGDGNVVYNDAEEELKRKMHEDVGIPNTPGELPGDTPKEMHFKLLASRKLIVYEWSYILDSSKKVYKRGKVEVPFESILRLNIIRKVSSAAQQSTVIILELNSPPDLSSGEQYWNESKKKRGYCGWLKGKAFDDQLGIAANSSRFHIVEVHNKKERILDEFELLLKSPYNYNLTSAMHLASLPELSKQGFGVPSALKDVPIPPSPIPPKKRNSGVKGQSGVHISKSNERLKRPRAATVRETDEKENIPYQGHSASKKSQNALPTPGKLIGSSDINKLSSHLNLAALAAVAAASVLTPTQPTTHKMASSCSPPTYYKWLNGLMSPIRASEQSFSGNGCEMSPSIAGMLESPPKTDEVNAPVEKGNDNESRKGAVDKKGESALQNDISGEHTIELKDKDQHDKDIRCSTTTVSKRTLESLSIVEIKAELNLRGLSCTGKRKELVDRLLADELNGQGVSSTTSLSVGKQIDNIVTPIKSKDPCESTATPLMDSILEDEIQQVFIPHTPTLVGTGKNGVYSEKQRKPIVFPMSLLNTPTPFKLIPPLTPLDPIKSDSFPMPVSFSECLAAIDDTGSPPQFEMPCPVRNNDDKYVSNNNTEEKSVSLTVPTKSVKLVFKPSNRPVHDVFELFVECSNRRVSKYFTVSHAVTPWHKAPTNQTSQSNVKISRRQHCILLTVKKEMTMLLKPKDRIFSTSRTHYGGEWCFVCGAVTEMFWMDSSNPLNTWLCNELHFDASILILYKTSYWRASVKPANSQRKDAMHICRCGHITVVYEETTHR